MKKLKGILLVPIVLAVSLIGCKDDDNDGKRCSVTPCPYTYQCKVNGEIWQPSRDYPFRCDDIETLYSPGYGGYKDGFLSIKAMDCNDNGHRIYLVIDSVTKPVLLDLTDSGTVKSYPSFIDGNQAHPSNVYDKIIDGQIEITLLQKDGYDYSSSNWGRVQGTFWMTLANNKDDTIHLTEGAFDVPLR
ncbi:MAG: hypothetical protein RLP14_09005 [Owenweeksia sp.]